MAKKRKRNYTRKPARSNKIPETNPVVKEKTNWSLKAVFGRFWKLIVTLSIIGSLFTYFDVYQIIKDAINPPKKDNYSINLQIPLQIFNKYSEIVIKIGSNTLEIPLSKVTEGVIYKPNLILIDGETPFELKFKRVGNNVFIATTFRDIDDRFVGIVDFTKWETAPKNVKYNNVDNNVELIDSYGNVLFNMKYQFPNTILLNGYFVGSTGVQIINNNGMIFYSRKRPDYKQVAINKIKQIKPIGK